MCVIMCQIVIRGGAKVGMRKQRGEERTDEERGGGGRGEMKRGGERRRGEGRGGQRRRGERGGGGEEEEKGVDMLGEEN